MAGGPGGLGDGVSSQSMAWAMVMSGFAAFGGILFGFSHKLAYIFVYVRLISSPIRYDTGIISGIMPMKDWLEVFGKFDPSLGRYLPTNYQGLVVSILSAGTFFGALLGYPMADFVGRKWGLVVACAIFSLGVGLQIDIKWEVFIIGRLISGFGVGLVSCLVPMYQSECAPKSVRGSIVGLYQLAITVGLLLSAIVLNATKDRPNHSSWRIPIAIQFVWAAILGCGMASCVPNRHLELKECSLQLQFFLPESPRFLLKRGHHDAAKKAMAQLLNKFSDSPEVEQECRMIECALEADIKHTRNSYLDCFRNNAARNRLRTWTGISLQAGQQLTGINFIYYYGTTFFTSAGIGDPFVITIICDVVNTVMTLVGVQLIDRIGRRRLLLWGGFGMCICEYIVAIVGVTAGNIQSDGSVNLPAQRVLVAFVCVYIAFFAMSWGPVTWVITGEIFPLDIRANGMSLAVASNWAWNFAIGYATPYLVNPTTHGVNGVNAANLGVRVFFIWGSTCLVCTIFTYFFVPETKGLSLEQIDTLYRETTAVNSNNYRKKLLETTAHFQDQEIDDLKKISNTTFP